MRKLLAVALAALSPLSAAVAQQLDSGGAFVFFGSANSDRTERPSGFNTGCWGNKSTPGVGVAAEFKTQSPLVFQGGVQYLGTHKNDDQCTPRMELKTYVVPLTVAYRIRVGDRAVIAPRLGVSYMVVHGEFNGQTSDDGSIDPTFGVYTEAALSRHWAVRAQLDRYAGKTNLFGLGTFHQRFISASIGGVFKW
jgi:outer membrane protein with beta-barrel domain